MKLFISIVAALLCSFSLFSMQQEKALVVVDMQFVKEAPGFTEFLEKLLVEVDKAKSENRWIIVVEYLFSDRVVPTLPCVTKKLSDHQKTFVVQKTQNTGAKEIIEAIKAHGLSINEIEVCGMNTDRCILDTLRKKFLYDSQIKLSVLSDCCWTVFARFHESALNAMMFIPSVEVKWRNINEPHFVELKEYLQSKVQPIFHENILKKMKEGYDALLILINNSQIKEISISDKIGGLLSHNDSSIIVKSINALALTGVSNEDLVFKLHSLQSDSDEEIKKAAIGAMHELSLQYKSFEM